MFGFSSPTNIVSVHEAFEHLGNEGHILLDVRRADEVRAAGITGALHIPLDRLEAEIQRLSPYTSIHIICRSGSRSGVAVNMLQAQGITHASNVSGGILAWQDAGFPVTRT